LVQSDVFKDFDRLCSMRHPKLLLLPFILAFALPLSAGTSELNAVTYNRQFTQLPLKKILVIGLADKVERRSVFEESFVDLIRRRGLDAETGLSLFPADQQISRDLIKKTMQEKGFDSVMVSRLYRVEARTGLIPGNRPKDFDHDYPEMANTVYAPGHLKKSQNFIIQTKIYASDGEFVWSAESETFDPSSIDDLVLSMAKAMGKDLSAKGIIAPPTGSSVVPETNR
jgi:hypothetical protein